MSAVRGSEPQALSAAREAVLPTYARADITIVRGEGCRVWDDTGRAYLDFVAGIAVTGLGHCAPAPLAAAREQLDRLWHASNLYWSEPMLRLAALLAERFPGGRAFFCNSGAEAPCRRQASRRSGRASGRSSPASRLRGPTTSNPSKRRSHPPPTRPSSFSSPCSARAG